MVFVELPDFTKHVAGVLDEDAQLALAVALMQNPRIGKVIPNSGGLRKVRWALPGRGKRGGTRVIYYWWNAENRITLCDIYAKNEKENLSSSDIKKLRKQLGG